MTLPYEPTKRFHLPLADALQCGIPCIRQAIFLTIALYRLGKDSKERDITWIV